MKSEKNNVIKRKLSAPSRRLTLKSRLCELHFLVVLVGLHAERMIFLSLYMTTENSNVIEYTL